MNLKPIIQSEVSQKKKGKYRILKHIYGIYKNGSEEFICRVAMEKLRNLYAGEEATVRTGHGTTDLFQIGKGVCQGCVLPPCLFNSEQIMRNTRLDEAQTGIKIAGRNINNLRYAGDTTLWQKAKN